MRLLLTAFEPFDGTGLNSSLAGCEQFVQRWESEFELEFAILPVAYGPDIEAVNAALARRPVDAVLHVGQAAGAAEVRVERIAVNVRYTRDEFVPNLTPWQREQVLIEPEGPPALFSTLPVDSIARAIRADGVPACVSNHAGIYLCNHVLYHSLRRSQLTGASLASGFLHVPMLPEQGATQPSMSARDIAIAIRAALRCISSQCPA
jgi:pyroglutamyl-peptidase